MSDAGQCNSQAHVSQKATKTVQINNGGGKTATFTYSCNF